MSKLLSSCLYSSRNVEPIWPVYNVNVFFVFVFQMFPSPKCFLILRNKIRVTFSTLFLSLLHHRRHCCQTYFMWYPKTKTVFNCIQQAGDSLDCIALATECVPYPLHWFLCQHRQVWMHIKSLIYINSPSDDFSIFFFSCSHDPPAAINLLPFCILNQKLFASTTEGCSPIMCVHSPLFRSTIQWPFPFVILTWCITLHHCHYRAFKLVVGIQWVSRNAERLYCNTAAPQ